MHTTYVDRLNHVWASMKVFAALVLAILIFVLLLGAALAQTVELPPAAPPVMGVLDLLKTNFLSPAGLAGLAITVLGIIGRFAWLTEKRKRILAKGVHHVFAIVEDIGNEMAGDDVFDKGARGLQELDKWLVLQGWRPASSAEQALAKMDLQAIHGNEIAKAKVIATAAVAIDATVAEATKIITAATTDPSPSAP